MDRMQFMRECVADTTGLVLNVGCHVDGAGLKGMAPERVLNCDIRVQPGYDYKIDRQFDARGPWPFSDNEAEMVVLGDILEHMYDEEIAAVLDEAGRVASKLCITVPNDELLLDIIDPDADYRAHCNTIDEGKIKGLLLNAGWNWDSFQVVEYAYVEKSEGYLILASRS